MAVHVATCKIHSVHVCIYIYIYIYIMLIVLTQIHILSVIEVCKALGESKIKKNDTAKGERDK